jgi:transcriptional regulator with XRE-family HTH domain
VAREILPAGPFGTALYDVLQTKRKPNRHPWGAKELARALGGRISAKQIREWIKGNAYPRIDDVMAVAEVLGVECGELWSRAAKPINLPQEGRSVTPPVAGGARVDHGRNVARATARQPLARDARRPPKPGPRRTG